MVHLSGTVVGEEQLLVAMRVPMLWGREVFVVVRSGKIAILRCRSAPMRLPPTQWHRRIHSSPG